MGSSPHAATAIVSTHTQAKRIPKRYRARGRSRMARLVKPALLRAPSRSLCDLRVRSPRMRVAVWVALSMGMAGSAAADDGPPQPLFSDTQVSARSGWHFEEPGVDGYDARHMVTLTHFDAWAYGRNYFFFDVTLPWQRAGSVQEVYGEAYASLGL